MTRYGKVKCKECIHKDKGGMEDPCCKCGEIMGSKYKNFFKPQQDIINDKQ